MPEQSPVVLVTGAARRIGACIARRLQQNNFRVVIHYQRSANAANGLCQELNDHRADSACAIRADLSDIDGVKQLAAASIARWGRLDALVNNASSFYPTPLPTATEEQWHELMGSNLLGPYFLCQATGAELTLRHGAIVNIADIHARQPLYAHSIYCIAKAGNVMLTKTMARELAPHVRVNGIAPGVILWPEKAAIETAGKSTDESQQNLIDKIPLHRMGQPEDIALLADFLITSASYITGQTIAVDGGKQLT